MEIDIYTVKQERDRPDDDPEFAARLKEFRKKTINPETGKGYTQRELAAKIGVSTTSYNGYEHGVVPAMRNLKKLADVLQCSTDVLLGVADTGEKVQKMSSLGNVARAFLGIAASGCIDMKSMNDGTVRITNNRLQKFLSDYLEVHGWMERYSSALFDKIFREWLAEELEKLDSTPIETDSQDIDEK